MNFKIIYDPAFRTSILFSLICECRFFKYIKSENEAVSVVIPPMLNAAASGDYDKIVSLLKNGESTNMIDSAGDSPYSLIGSSPVELNNVGNSALAFAVWNGVYPVNQNA